MGFKADLNDPAEVVNSWKQVAMMLALLSTLALCFMLSNCHILIVEHDPVTSTTLAAYICKEGYKVSTAPDGVTMRDLFAKVLWI